MNYKLMIYVIGQILKLEAALMCSALVVCLYYFENEGLSFLSTMILLGFIGVICTAVKPDNKVIYPREGLIVVSIAWILLAFFGAIPFYSSQAIPSFVDSFFETASGFTTTGASILTEIESLPRGILFWRSFIHWIGGMGVLVLVLTVMSTSTGHTLHLMRAEVPGPTVEKLVPKIKHSAKILYSIYVVLTVAQMFFLILTGMPIFDSMVNAFATAGTGGFAIKNLSIGVYNPASQWVITIFMILFGVNFNIFYLLMLKDLRSVFKNQELKFYLSVVAISVAMITWNVLPLYSSLGESFRHASFQVASIISTTGFSTTDFNVWPELSKMTLVFLMFMGASAGSTAGGLKVSRIVLIFKTIKREMTKIIHPRVYKVIKMDGKVVDESIVSNTGTYFTVYIFCIGLSILLISLDGFDFETTVTSVIACFNNIGPGLGMVGPMGNYSQFSDFGKIVLSINMLMGRLEIFPFIILFTPAAWRKF